MVPLNTPGGHNMLSIQILFVLSGTVGLILFTVPLLQPHPTVQIGNVTGIFCSFTSLLIGIKLPDTIAIAINLSHRPVGRVLLLILIAVLLLIICLALMTGYCILSAARISPSENAVLIVLGCQVHGKIPSNTLVRRLTAAKQYLDAHPMSVCIVCGGKGEGENITEALCMFSWLTEHGIEAARIHMEDKSTTTEENLRFTVPILDKVCSVKSIGDLNDSDLNGVCGGNTVSKIAKLAIISSDYHLYRALFLAGKLGLAAGAVPAPTPWYLYPTYFVREQYGILYYWLEDLCSWLRFRR